MKKADAELAKVLNWLSRSTMPWISAITVADSINPPTSGGDVTSFCLWDEIREKPVIHLDYTTLHPGNIL